jgi:hypothetical protein
MNWTGHVLSAPRARIVEVLRRPEASRTGIYFLIGSDPEKLGQVIVYIGESDNVGDRLASHNRDESKDFWETTCIITNKDANLTKAHAKFLESKLIQLTKKAGRANLQNGTSPEYGYLPESDVSDMEFFIEQLQTLLPVLGIEFLRLAPQIVRPTATAELTPSTTTDPARIAEGNEHHYRKIFGQERPTSYGGESPEFYLSQGGVHANAIEVDGQMVVLKGSEAREQESPSLSSNVRLARQQLRQAAKLVESGKQGILKFEEDVAFSSPSAASQAVMGTSRNGRIDWKVLGTDETYAKWQESAITQILTEIESSNN